MAKQKKKLTMAQKREKAERRRRYKTVFLNGKQVRIEREPTIDGIPEDQFIVENADPIWLHQNELWHLMPENQCADDQNATDSAEAGADENGEIPF